MNPTRASRRPVVAGRERGDDNGHAARTARGGSMLPLKGLFWR